MATNKLFDQVIEKFKKFYSVDNDQPLRIEWSRHFKSSNKSKLDGYRFVGEWDKENELLFYAKGGVHVAKLSFITGQARTAKYENGVRKWSDITHQVAIAYQVGRKDVNNPECTKIKIIGVVGYEGNDVWGKELHDIIEAWREARKPKTEPASPSMA